MRLRVITFVVLCSGLTVMWACSLNPQPFPPDGYDAAADSVLTASPDAAGGTDANSSDGGPPFGDDAATDASVGDATDAADASSDAAEDARDDVGDAGEDG